MQINRLFGFCGGGDQPAPEPVEVIGNGFVGHNQGQLFGRTLLADVPIFLDHADAIGGPPHFRMTPQSMCIAWGKIDLSVTGDQRLRVIGGSADESYIVRRAIFGNVRGTVTSATVDMWSAANASGRQLLSDVDLTALDITDPRLVVEEEIALGYSQTAPTLYVRVSDPEVEPLLCDVYVYADQLHMPGLPLP